MSRSCECRYSAPHIIYIAPTFLAYLFFTSSNIVSCSCTTKRIISRCSAVRPSNSSPSSASSAYTIFRPRVGLFGMVMMVITLFLAAVQLNILSSEISLNFHTNDYGGGLPPCIYLKR